MSQELSQKKQVFLYAVGDVVRLKSGGPSMTVEGIIGELSKDKNAAYLMTGHKLGDVLCKYYLNGKFENVVFIPAMLIRVDDIEISLDNQ